MEFISIFFPWFEGSIVVRNVNGEDQSEESDQLKIEEIL